MSRAKGLAKWFLWTLGGYTVTFATLDKFYHVKHRPFRQPKMWIDKSKGIRGKDCTLITFDEMTETPVESYTMSVGIAKAKTNRGG